MKTDLLSYFTIVLLCTSCMSYQPISRSGEKTSAELQTAYILNSIEHKRAARVLKYSSRYDLDVDTNVADIQIELKVFEERSLNCITPQVTVLIATLGFFPVRTRHLYHFEYIEIENGERSQIKESIEIDKVVSWFHLFSLKKSRLRAVAEAMAMELQPPKALNTP